MDFVVKKTDLFAELQYVQGVVERRTTVPILSNLLLETSGNSLIITATDLDVTIQCSCAAAVKVSGAVAISARKLFEIVRLLPELDVHFKAGALEWVNINCERSRFKVPGLSKENFPDVPSVGSAPIALPTSALRYMIGRCIFAITQEESRYQLNGALMVLKPKSLTFVATDGHRLAFISREVRIGGLETEMRVLIPKKTLGELSKLAAEDILAIEFGSSENHLFFRTSKRLLISRLLTGQFPNYELVIPRDNNLDITIAVTELADALRRAAIMADEQSRSVKFSFHEGQLDISTASADVGEARESLTAEFAGESFDIGFNAQYLLDFLTTLEGEQVTFQLKDNETQALLRPKPQGDCTYQYVIMPLKI